MARPTMLAKEKQPKWNTSPGVVHGSLGHYSERTVNPSHSSGVLRLHRYPDPGADHLHESERSFSVSSNLYQIL